MKLHHVLFNIHFFQRESLVKTWKGTYVFAQMKCDNDDFLDACKKFDGHNSISPGTFKERASHLQPRYAKEFVAWLLAPLTLPSPKSQSEISKKLDALKHEQLVMWHIMNKDNPNVHDNNSMCCRPSSDALS